MRSVRESLRIWLICLFVALGALRAAEPGVAGRWVLLRHAERISLFDKDSALSPLGERRAAALAAVLEKYHPKTLVASNKRRTQQTLAPLAERSHLPVKIWEAEQTAQLAAWLKTAAGGGTVIVCWHHDHLRELARALGVPEPIPAWSAFTYDKLWIIDLEADGSLKLHVETQPIRP